MIFALQNVFLGFGQLKTFGFGFVFLKLLETEYR